MTLAASLVAGVLLAAGVGLAQTARLTCVVRSPDGAPFEGASVRLMSLETGVSRVAETGADGRYQFTDLPPGRYTLEVRAPGFRTIRRSRIRLTADKDEVYDLRLREEPVEAPDDKPPPAAVPAPPPPPPPARPQQPAGPSGPDRPGRPETPRRDWSQVLAEEMGKLTEGRILFNPPEQMRVGRRELVEVRITQNVAEDLREGLKGRGVPQVEKIKVGAFMAATLKGSAFEITPLSEAEQFVTPEGFTEWSWNVAPRESGEHPLNLSVTVRVQVPELGEQRKSLPVMQKTIRVEVDPASYLVDFWSGNWQWLLSVIIIPVFLWALRARKKLRS